MTEAKIVCIYCSGEMIIKDLELFILKLSEASEVLKSKLNITNENEITRMLKVNNIVDVRRELEEKGHIRMACIPCHLKTSWEEMM